MSYKYNLTFKELDNKALRKVLKANREIVVQLLKEEHEKKMAKLTELQVEQNMTILADENKISFGEGKGPFSSINLKKKSAPRVILKSNFVRKNWLKEFIQEVRTGLDEDFSVVQARRKSRSQIGTSRLSFRNPVNVVLAEKLQDSLEDHLYALDKERLNLSPSKIAATFSEGTDQYSPPPSKWPSEMKKTSPVPLLFTTTPRSSRTGSVTERASIRKRKVQLEKIDSHQKLLEGINFWKEQNEYANKELKGMKIRYGRQLPRKTLLPPQYNVSNTPILDKPLTRETDNDSSTDKVNDMIEDQEKYENNIDENPNFSGVYFQSYSNASNNPGSNIHIIDGDQEQVDNQIKHQRSLSQPSLVSIYREGNSQDSDNFRGISTVDPRNYALPSRGLGYGTGVLETITSVADESKGTFGTTVSNALSKQERKPVQIRSQSVITKRESDPGSHREFTHSPSHMSSGSGNHKLVFLTQPKVLNLELTIAKKRSASVGKPYKLLYSNSKYWSHTFDKML